MCLYGKAYAKEHPPTKRYRYDIEQRRVWNKKYNESKKGQERNNRYKKEYNARPGVKERQVEDRNARISQNKKWIDSIKLERGCKDCGYKRHPHALDFDHMPGFEKSFEVSQSVGRSKENLLKEIEKCELVCANCHRIRTASRRLVTEFF